MTTTTLSRRLTCHLSSGAITNHHQTKHGRKIKRGEITENVEIVERENDGRRLRFLEAIYIQLERPALNIQTDDLNPLPTMKRHATMYDNDPKPKQTQ